MPTRSLKAPRGQDNANNPPSTGICVFVVRIPTQICTAQKGTCSSVANSRHEMGCSSRAERVQTQATLAQVHPPNLEYLARPPFAIYPCTSRTCISPHHVVALYVPSSNLAGIALQTPVLTFGRKGASNAAGRRRKTTPRRVHAARATYRSSAKEPARIVVVRSGRTGIALHLGRDGADDNDDDEEEKEEQERQPRRNNRLCTVSTDHHGQ